MAAVRLVSIALGFQLLAACSGEVGDQTAPGQERPGTPSPMGSPAGQGEPSPSPGTSPQVKPDGSPEPAGCGPARRRLYLLSGEAYGRTIATLFAGRSTQANQDRKTPTGLNVPFRDATSAGRFSTGVDSFVINESRFAAAMNAAEDVSQRLVAEPALQPCLSGTESLAGCLRPIVKDKGELLFRRPMTTAEVDRYVSAAAGVEASAGRKAAAALAFKAMLMSPEFVYRSERGEAAAGGRFRLTPFEIASAISYSLTEGPPDVALWTDATNGKLGDPTVIKQHVARLLQAMETSAPVQRFLNELFGYELTTSINRPDGKFKAFDLVAQADQFVATVLKEAGHKDLLKTLLTSRTAHANAATAKEYAPLTGAAPTAATTAPVTFMGERQGILGHPAWLSSYTQPDHTDPVSRGLFVATRLLCVNVPNAPIGMIPPLPDDPKRTVRNRLVAHRAEPSCGACHDLFDPIGLALESFDIYGRFRTVDLDGKPVDRSGRLTGTDVDGPIEGLDGLVTKLVSSQQAVSCFAQNAFEYFMGSAATGREACTVADAARAYTASSGDLAALVQALFTSDSYLHRVN